MPPQDAKRLNPNISDELYGLIHDLMENNPSLRVQSMAEVVERLSDIEEKDGPDMAL